MTAMPDQRSSAVRFLLCGKFFPEEHRGPQTTPLLRGPGWRSSMPNGGPDNCSTCGFNRRNRGVWRNSAPDEDQLPFCEIRGIPVFNDHWTYCQNWHTRTRAPIGPIYASGMYDEGYRRIP